MQVKLEKIEWLDHSGYETAKWRNLEELEDLGPVRLSTVGWVVHETKEAVTIVNTISDDGELMHGDFCIVKKAIVSRKEL